MGTGLVPVLVPVLVPLGSRRCRKGTSQLSIQGGLVPALVPLGSRGCSNMLRQKSKQGGLVPVLVPLGSRSCGNMLFQNRKQAGLVLVKRVDWLTSTTWLAKGAFFPTSTKLAFMPLYVVFEDTNDFHLFDPKNISSVRRVKVDSQDCLKRARF